MLANPNCVVFRFHYTKKTSYKTRLHMDGLMPSTTLITARSIQDGGAVAELGGVQNQWDNQHLDFTAFDSDSSCLLSLIHRRAS